MSLLGLFRGSLEVNKIFSDFVMWSKSVHAFIGLTFHFLALSLRWWMVSLSLVSNRKATVTTLTTVTETEGLRANSYNVRIQNTPENIDPDPDPR